MPKFAANLTMMFNEVPFAERFRTAAIAGFDAVECLFPYSMPSGDFARALASHGLKQAMFNLFPGDWDAGDRGMACHAARFDEVKRSVDLGLEYATAAGVDRLHLMAGMGDPRDSTHLSAYIRSVDYVAERFAEHGLNLLIEPINSRSMPGYFLNDFNLAEKVIHDLGRSNVFIQFDIFHRQIIHGDVVTSFRRLLPIVGHVQIASVPSRHEPDREEINYPHVFALLDEAGYQGFVGCEYVPQAGTLAGLAWFEPYKRRQ